MRLIYVTDAFAVWGGMERVLADKMNILVGQYGWEVILLTTNQGKHPLTYELHTKIRHIDLDIRMHQQYKYHGIQKVLKRWNLKKKLKEGLKKTLVGIKPDVIVCVKLDFVPVLVDLKGDIPLIVESHTLCHSEKMDEVGMLRRLYIGSLKRSIRKADAVVALTEGDANDWKAYNDNVHVIQNIVTLNESGFYTSCKQKSVIYVGRFSKQKDIDSLLRIWEIIHQQYPDWQLDIYGEGELKDNYLSIIQKMNANINVFQPTANIMEVYREHSILLLTSLYEPFGLVLPEAMSCGLPVVAFDCPYGPADIITDGVDGYLIEDRDVELFAQRVGQLISDYDLRVQMGKAGIASSKRYQASCIIPQWIQLFEQLTSSRGK